MVAHFRLARMYQQLGLLCAKRGDYERARHHRDKANAHLSKARSGGE